MVVPDMEILVPRMAEAVEAPSRSKTEGTAKSGVCITQGLFCFCFFSGGIIKHRYSGDYHMTKDTHGKQW